MQNLFRKQYNIFIHNVVYVFLYMLDKLCVFIEKNKQILQNNSVLINKATTVPYNSL